MSAEQKLRGNDFFASHAVFSLDEAAAALIPEGKRLRVVERPKHHLRTGRLKRVKSISAKTSRGVFTVMVKVFWSLPHYRCIAPA
jgi:hypothetical protein